jgi:hypothetical protein
VVVVGGGCSGGRYRRVSNGGELVGRGYGAGDPPRVTPRGDKRGVRGKRDRVGKWVWDCGRAEEWVGVFSGTPCERRMLRGKVRWQGRRVRKKTSYRSHQDT